jgi:hypothetical protein
MFCVNMSQVESQGLGIISPPFFIMKGLQVLSFQLNQAFPKALLQNLHKFIWCSSKLKIEIQL